MTYHIEYKMHSADAINRMDVIAKNKADAYWKSIDQIALKEGYPFAAWVSGVTYQNGNYRRFNNFEGNPY